MSRAMMLSTAELHKAAVNIQAPMRTKNKRKACAEESRAMVKFPWNFLQFRSSSRYIVFQFLTCFSGHAEVLSELTVCVP